MLQNMECPKEEESLFGCLSQVIWYLQKMSKNSLEDIVLKTGIIAKSFPVNKSKILSEGEVSNDKEKSQKLLIKVKRKALSKFGVMINSRFVSCKTTPKYSGKYIVLDDVIQSSKDVEKSFFISKSKKLKVPLEKKQMDGTVYSIKTEMDKWKYLKGRKKNSKQINLKDTNTNMLKEQWFS